MICGAQMSKTEYLFNEAFSRLDEGPRQPTLLLVPTRDLSKRIADRIDQSIRLIPSLWELTEKGRRASLRQRLIGGVRFAITYAGSKSELASDPYAIVLADEIDKYLEDVDGEGDAVTLARGRTKTYRRWLLVRTTTPTIQGSSPGEKAFQEGSMEIWQWECPECATWFPPMPEMVRWKGCELGFYCPACAHRFTDADAVRARHGGRFWPHVLSDKGEYVPRETPEPANRRHRSFWVTGANTWALTLTELCERLQAAYQSGDPERIQAELNTTWGTWWTTSGERPEWEAVRERAGAYLRGEIPEHCRGLTMGVDVQQDRLEWMVMGFGPNFRKWVIDWGTLFGDPRFPQVWAELGDMQGKRYRNLAITRCLVDSGYNPGYDYYRRESHVVYAAVRALPGWAYAWKGYDGATVPLRQSKGQEQGILWLGDASYYKTMIYAELQAEEQRIQVPSDITEEICRELVSEELIKLPSGRTRWRQSRHRPNHRLDCAVMCIAAAQTLNWQQWRVEDLRTRKGAGGITINTQGGGMGVFHR